jgi:hypothetical protein
MRSRNYCDTGPTNRIQRSPRFRRGGMSIVSGAGPLIRDVRHTAFDRGSAVQPTYPSLIWGLWILPALVAVSWILLQTALAKLRNKRLTKNTNSSK